MKMSKQDRYMERHGIHTLLKVHEMRGGRGGGGAEREVEAERKEWDRSEGMVSEASVLKSSCLSLRTAKPSSRMDRARNLAPMSLSPSALSCLEGTSEQQAVCRSHLSTLYVVKRETKTGDASTSDETLPEKSWGAG